MMWVRKNMSVICIAVLLLLLFVVVLRPVITSKYIDFAKKHSRGRFTCTTDRNGIHVAKLYKISGGKEKLVKTSYGNSCIFSRPKVNVGFFIFAIGGGGGATPYESGSSGKIVSKYKNINKPVIVIKVGQGGHGTFVGKNDEFIDAQNGYPTLIDDLKIIAEGGLRSSRMTPTGGVKKQLIYHIPEKYHYLYNIPKSVKYGAGGQFNNHTKNISAKAQNGHSGAVIILW